ncbi:MAG: diguanylate cyclase domain-containing protein [Bacilli bacterium]
MKNKKSFIIIISIVVVLILGLVYLFTKQDKNTSFTLLEKQWLENNKSKVIDISILKDIPVINYNGNGLLFDFINDFEEVTGLDFNPIASTGDVKAEYSFQVVDQKNDNDILVYSDNYALLTKNNVKYNKLSEISNLKIGVLEGDLEKLSNIMDGNSVTFQSFQSVDEMVNGLVPNETGESVDAIVLPKISYFALIISNQNLHISYNINEIKQDYVIRLGSDEKLNEVITKYFKKWKELKYDESFGKHFSSNYFSFSNVDDKGKALFKSKRYVYGYIDNKPYDSLINDNLYGINKSFLNSFSELADIDIDYKNYSSIDSLIGDFNSGNVDLFFDNLSNTEYSASNVNLISNYDEQITVLALPTNKVTVSSVKSLIGYDVATLSNTKLASYLESSGISVKTYDNLSTLLNKVKDDVIIVLDSEMYNFYASDSLNDYKAIYTFNLEDQYSFKVLDNDDNKLFINFFNFYLSFISNQELSNIGYSDLVSINSSKGIVHILILGIIVILTGLIGILFHQNKKNPKVKVNVPRDSKIKYIDVLTSLKNRNYLNDNIDAWDDSLVYPQGIVIVDLNNIAYINDNYGHAEGDNVIKEAANILIKSQISNTEIIRTNGNEFLIYMVGYDEKQIVSYIRKLNKEFKDLSHSFGAAIGYSIITDEIKTIDDAINEATLDMRNVKQENK